MDLACFAYETIAIREGRLVMSDHSLSREQTNEIVSCLVRLRDLYFAA